MAFWTFAKGVRKLVQLRRRVRGPLRPSWDETYETLALVLHQYSKRSVHLPVSVQRRIAAGFFSKSPVVKQTKLQREQLGGVPASWLRRSNTDPSRVLLYLHGGGYVIGSVDTHLDLLARLCRGSGSSVVAIDYRLAPEHIFPAQLEDALAAYRALLAGGVEPHRLVVGGESAGGGLTMSLLVKLRDEALPLPAAAFCISPWVDLEGLGASMEHNERFDYVNRKILRAFAGHFVSERDLRNPLAAPCYADLSGLPPLLVQAGGAEVLLDDANILAERAKQAGVDAELDIWPDMIHAWHAFAPLIPAGRKAIAKVCAFVRTHQGAAKASDNAPDPNADPDADPDANYADADS